MSKILFLFFLLSSCGSSLYAANTSEKWVCTNRGLVRVVRLQSDSVGSFPCKVFYFKRDKITSSDSAQETLQDSGSVKPIYFSTGNGGFCVRKMEVFIEDKKDHGWICSKV